MRGAARPGRDPRSGRPSLSALRAAALLIALSAVCSLYTPAAATAPPGVWTPLRSGTMTGLRSVFFLDEKKGWIVGGAGVLLVTADGGASWQARRRPTEDTLWDVWFADAENGWLLVERSIYKLKEVDEPRTYLLRTADGGANWDRIEIEGLNPDVLLNRFVFPDPARAYVFGEGGTLFYTRDGGETWKPGRTGVRQLLLGAAFPERESGWVVGAGGTLLSTTDGGETWRIRTLDAAGGRLNAVTFVGARLGWIVGAGGLVFHTTNGGTTWRRQETGQDEDLTDVRFVNAREGWAVGRNGTVLHTDDAGNKWSPEWSGTKHPLARLAFQEAARRGYAVGFGGTIISYSAAASSR